MIKKTDKHQYYFEVEVKQLEGPRFSMRSKNVKNTLEVATAAVFKNGVPGTWSAEELFLGSMCSGYMSAFLGLARIKKLHVTQITCSAIGQVNLYDNHLEFTTINLYPKVTIESDDELQCANELVLSAYKQCIVANSVKSMLINHGEVTVENAHVS